MSHTVARAFASRTRRFSPGAPVTPADIDGDITFDRWVELGFVVAADAPAEQAAPEPAVQPEPEPHAEDEHPV